MQNLDNLYDVIVIGGGPAGLTAGLYLARARYRVLIVEAEQFGGQITITSEVVNYPGVERTNGKELTENMRKQAESFGAEFLLAEVEKLDMDGDVKTVYTSRGTKECFGVVLATGAHPRMVGFKGEAEFRGHGVAYCATCDGEFFTGKDVFVIGGGFAAAEEGVFLTKYARHVTIIIRKDDFSCAKSAADAARANEKITVLTNTVVDEVTGDSVLRAMKYHNTLTGETTEYRAADGDTFGVFVFAGYEPATDLVKDLAELDRGYVITDRNQATRTEGLYAAGDVCVKNLRQVVTAVGDGATAATQLEKYVAALEKKTGLVPKKPVSTPQAARSEATPIDETSTKAAETASALFTPDIIAQLNVVFGRMARPLKLVLYLNEAQVSRELKIYMDEMASLTDKLTVETAEHPEEEENRPCVKVCLADGTWTGLAFHGVPGGHEFTSFIMGLYNAAGPGQSLDADTIAQIRGIGEEKHMQVMVALSCTMCPDLVTAAQRIAVENEKITAEIYDLNHFPALRDKYQVMSVPCLVINGELASFGKKNITQLLEILTK